MSNILRELIRRSWDCSSYEDRPLTTEVILELLEAVRWTQSAANVQPWEFFLIQEPEKRLELESCILDPFLRPAVPNGQLEQAGVVAIAAIDRKRAAARHGEVGERLLAIQDTAVAISHLRLVAAQRGISSVWIREVDLLRVAEVLSLPAGLVPVALLTFGYPAETPKAVQGMAVREWTHVIGA
jgi:nitroreductase